MVELQPSKLATWVRFPSPAPTKTPINGRLRRFNLDIEIEGERPPSLTDVANWQNAAFQRSYGRAREAHDTLLKRELSQKHTEELAQRIIEAKTGTRLDFVKVEAVPEAWAALPRKRPPCPQYVETAKGKLRRFVDFMRPSEVVERGLGRGLH